MDDREALEEILSDLASTAQYEPEDINDSGLGEWLDSIFALLRERGWTNDPVAVSLLEQVRKLRKVCPDADFREDGMCRTDMNLDCPIEGGCNGTGTLPIEAGDVVVKLREG